MSFYITKVNESGSIAVDDTILLEGVPSTAGSYMLQNFKPLFSADSVERLQKAGYTISGKTNVGEFGLDLVGEFSHFETETKEDSLTGAAQELVAKGEITAALSVDLNGAPRRAAAISGVDFIKPTYGTVSRYGVISGAASGEQIGVNAKNIADLKAVLSTISGYDAKDGTSHSNASYVYETDLEVKGTRVGVVKELVEMSDDSTKAKIVAYIEKLKKLGVTVEEISLDIVKVANEAWKTLMCAEVCNNLSRYDGVKFGHRTANYENIDELYVNTRTEGFNFLTKAVILYGSEVLTKDKYLKCYDKSLRIRRMVFDKIKETFKQYDALLTPAVSTTELKPYPIEEAFQKVFEESVFTAIPNLIGIPALVTGGVQLMGAHFDESILLSLGLRAERMGE